MGKMKRAYSKLSFCPFFLLDLATRPKKEERVRGEV
jgi:hypothetical protein